MSAFEWGGECFVQGYGVHQNPYIRKSYDWKRWIKGWVAKCDRPLTPGEIEFDLEAGW